MLTLLLASAAIQTATPAPAPAAPETKVKEMQIVILQKDGAKAAAELEDKVKERVVLITRNGKDETPEGESRIVRLHQMGGNHGDHMMMMADCGDGTRVEGQGNGEKDGKKTETKVVVCAKDGNQLEALEKVQKHIAENKDIPDDVRTKDLASLDAQIARLKADKK